VGNFAGIGLCLLQKYFHIIKLSQDSYYLSYAPVEMNWNWILALNAGTVIITLVLLTLPTLLISRISPVKAIRFE
jgi:lipoprotein-releasing system permease protein